MKRVYISGPMTGIPESNFPAFNAEAARLRALGYEVVNSAELNPDPATGWHQCMRVDLAALLTCDTLALIPGWQKSQGAHLEMHVASRVGIEIVVAAELQPLGQPATFQTAKAAGIIAGDGLPCPNDHDPDCRWPDCLCHARGRPPGCECNACIAKFNIGTTTLAPTATPGIKAATFLPLSATRMILCPTCGNKRCPRANNHRNACSGSNEPGQAGSAYP